MLDSRWSYFIGCTVLVGLAIGSQLIRCGAEEAEGERADRPLGRWRELRRDRVDPQLSDEQRERIARLSAIGYATGSTEAPERTGTTVHDEDRTYRGLNFYTSGHAPEALLVDMDGRVLHRWSRGYLEVWPDYPRDWLDEHEGWQFWRRAHLMPNGDVIAIFEGMGIIRIDRDSRVIWSNPVGAHHDLEVMPDGDVYVLTRRAHLVPRIDAEHPVLEDFISVLDEEGVEKRRISLLRALERSDFDSYWSPEDRIGPGDLLHTNTLSVLDRSIADRIPEFARGNLLVSMLVPDLIAVVDLDAERIVWATKGAFRNQHDPKILDNGNLLLFDNEGAGERSRVLEFDPRTPGNVVWEYAGSPDRPFFSATCGSAERLPNGNTLIVESDGGRAFEVHPTGEIVWEYYNPHRAGPDDRLIATLFDLVRLPPDFPTDWIGNPDWLTD